MRFKSVIADIRGGIVTSVLSYRGYIFWRPDHPMCPSKTPASKKRVLKTMLPFPVIEE
jgi:hypothetical protein